MSLTKPDICSTCPLAGNMQGFVPDDHVPGATTAILAQNPGRDEECEGKPMVGATGQLQDTQFLPLAGLDRTGVSVLNVLKCRWEQGGRKVNDLPPEPVLSQAMAHCTQHHLQVPPEVTHVVVQGSLALRCATGRMDKIREWRGHALEEHLLGACKVFAVEHLANVIRDPNAWWMHELDWRRVGRWKQGDLPLSIPPRLLISGAFDLGVWKDQFASAFHAPYIVVDTEYVGGGRPHSPGFLTLLGMGWSHPTLGFTGIQVDWSRAEPWTKRYVSEELLRLLRQVPVIFHNAMADIPVLKVRCGIPYSVYRHIDDTMLAHAVLYSELPHDLAFLDSLYGQYPKLKHLQDSDPFLYNWGDVLATYSLWQGLSTTFQGDPQAYRVYSEQSLRLIPHLLKSMEQGLRVNAERALELKTLLEGDARVAQATARAYLGWTINLGSDEHLKYYAYTERALPIQKDLESGNPTMAAEALARLRELTGPPIEENEDPSIEGMTTRIREGGDPILEARVLYQSAQHLVDAYIYPLHAEVAGTQKGERKRALDGVRGVVWSEGNLVERVYPQLSIHTQKTGRWSISNPPMAQLPAWMRDLIIPNEEEAWIEWDWSAIEAHILEVECGSALMKEIHEKGWDGHTYRLCRTAGWDMPPNLNDPHEAPENEAWRAKYKWQGGDDGRRVFMKTATFEMFYGGTGANAARKATKLGFNSIQIKAMVSRLMTDDADYFRWRQHIEDQVRKTRIVRTFSGRPRRCLGVSKQGKGVSAKVLREAINAPMQGGVADILNTTLVLLLDTYPFMTLRYTVHDAAKVAVPLTLLTPTLAREVEAIVTRAHRMGGQEKRFPAKFKLTGAPITWKGLIEG